MGKICVRAKFSRSWAQALGGRIVGQHEMILLKGNKMPKYHRAAFKGASLFHWASAQSLQHNSRLMQIAFLQQHKEGAVMLWLTPQHNTGSNTPEQAAPVSPPASGPPQCSAPFNSHSGLALNPVILFVRILLNRFIGLLGEEGAERQRGGLGSLSQSEEPGLEGKSKYWRALRGRRQWGRRSHTKEIHYSSLRVELPFWLRIRRGNRLFSRKPQTLKHRKLLETIKQIISSFPIFLLIEFDASLWNKYTVRVHFGFLLVYLPNDQTLTSFGKFCCLKLIWELCWEMSWRGSMWLPHDEVQISAGVFLCLLLFPSSSLFLDWSHICSTYERMRWFVSVQSVTYLYPAADRTGSRAKRRV